MSYYGGTITVQGRNLITSLIAGETIQFTRIMVGKGSVPEGVEPLDMVDLAEPVAEGSSTVPAVSNGVMSMTVEYRNDMNGGLKEGFWLREFGIYAKTPDTEEILLYYATLGDSPQPVNAFIDNRIDIRRYPITIALELTDSVEVVYSPGAFVTSEEVDDLLNDKVARIQTAIAQKITIPTSLWVESSDFSDYPYEANIECSSATNKSVPIMSIMADSFEAAADAKVCPTIESTQGKIRMWSVKVPAKDLNGFLALILGGSGTGSSGLSEIPVATETVLGGIMVKNGSGLTIDENGNLSIEEATEDEILEIYANASAREEKNG